MPLLRAVERNKGCTCKQCGKLFYAVHYNAETCSTKCRKAYSRYLADAERIYQVANDAITALASYHRTERDELAFKSIRALQSRLQVILDFWD